LLEWAIRERGRILVATRELLVALDVSKHLRLGGGAILLWILRLLLLRRDVLLALVLLRRLLERRCGRLGLLMPVNMLSLGGKLLLVILHWWLLVLGLGRLRLMVLSCLWLLIRSRMLLLVLGCLLTLNLG
jgi:hypothetical protein